MTAAVKSLQWEEPSSSNNNLWVARTILGVYCVGCDGGWWFATLEDGMKWEWEPESDARSYSGPLMAQDACFAHFAGQILSVIEPLSTTIIIPKKYRVRTFDGVIVSEHDTDVEAFAAKGDRQELIVVRFNDQGDWVTIEWTGRPIVS